MLCAEDSQEEIHRRVHRIHKQAGSALTPAMKARLKDNFLIRSVAGMDSLLTQATKSNEIVQTQLTEQLLLTAQQAKNLKLIIFDPAARYRGGDENSNPHATRFVQTLEYLALNTGATVLIAHHTGKGANVSKETNQDASRGASALTDGIRWQMALTSLTSTTKGYSGLPKDTRHLYMEAKLVKTNYTAPQPSVLLLRSGDGYLQATADLSDANPPFIQEKLDQIAVFTIIRDTPKGVTARQLEMQYGGLAKGLKLSEKALRSLINNARFNGFLEGESGKPLVLTEKALEFLQAQRGGAARQAPRGNTARRTKT
jgi:RecA-family ATPase